MSLAVEQRASMYCTSPGFCLHSFSGTWIQHSDLKGGRYRHTLNVCVCARVCVHMCVCALGVREHASINERWQRTRSPCWGAPLEVPVITKFRTTIPRGSLRSGWKEGQCFLQFCDFEQENHSLLNAMLSLADHINTV